MVSHNYQAHIFNAIVGVDQLVCKDVFKAFFMTNEGSTFQCNWNACQWIVYIFFRLWIDEFTIWALCIHDFGNILMLIFLFSLHLGIIKDTLLLTKKWETPIARN
jgi:hypothetical protein